MEATLTFDEIHLAAVHGVYRMISSMKEHRKEYSHKGSGWDDEIEAACAELAFCKMRGLYWSGCSAIKEKDAGWIVDVRWTRHAGTGGLFLYTRDDPKAWFVLIDGRAPTFKFVGCLIAEEGMREEYKTAKGDYLVPRERLKVLVSKTAT